MVDWLLMFGISMVLITIIAIVFTFLMIIVTIDAIFDKKEWLR